MDIRDRDLDLIARTVIGEAAKEPPIGQAAVAHVIRNRLMSGDYGESVPEVLFAPKQFEPWGARRSELLSYTADNPVYQRASAIAQAVLEGRVPDPTGGATHFYGPASQAALGRNRPSWDNGTGQDIGGHRFFKLGEGPGRTRTGRAPDDLELIDDAAPSPPASKAGPAKAAPEDLELIDDGPARPAPLVAETEDQVQAAERATGMTPSDWQKFKAGLGAIARDPSLLLQVGPMKAAVGGAEVMRDAVTGELPLYPSEYAPEQLAKATEGAALLTPGAPARITTQGLQGVPRGAQRSVLPGGGAPEAASPPLVVNVTPNAAPAAPATAGPSFSEAVQRRGLADVTPRFIGTDSRTLQATAQGLKQSPIGGATIEKAAGRFLEGVGGQADRAAADAAGTGAKAAAAPLGGDIRRTLEGLATEREALGQLAQEGIGAMAGQGIRAAEQEAGAAVQGFEGLAPAPRSRAAVGSEMTRALENSIEAHSAAMSEPYEALRLEHINPLRPVPEAREPLREVLSRIFADRENAGERGPVPTALRPVVSLMRRGDGPNFDGLQRARSRLGEVISDFDPHQGFSKGDLKAAYGALTEAMRIATERSARSDPQAALGALQAANENFSTRLDRIGDLRKALRSSPEALADRFVQFAGERGGANMDRLTALLQEVPAPVREQLADLTLQRLARGPTGEFSHTALARNWANISPEGRAALFGDRAQTIDAAVTRVAGTREAADVTRGLLESATQTQARGIQGAVKQGNAEITALLNRSDESIVDTMLHWARSGARADIGKLARVSRQVGPDAVKGLASVAIDRLGRSTPDSPFSPAFFRTNWRKLSEDGKRQLFPDPAIRQTLDDLAVISDRAATVQERYANHSNTARAGLLGGLGAHFLADPFSALGLAGGTFAVSKLLSQPMTARLLGGWAKAYEASVAKPSAETAHAVSSAAGRLASAAAKADVPLDTAALVGPAARALAAGRQSEESGRSAQGVPETARAVKTLGRPLSR